MINNFKKPDLKAPRFRFKRKAFLNKYVIQEFKELFPMYKNIDNDILKKIVKMFNEKLWTGVIENRDGVELPSSLGYIFIGTCPPRKSVNTNYALSAQYGKVLQNQNWETDGNVGKIFYTNWSSKYRFKNRELWRFEAVRKFKRSVAKSYPENWNRYVFMKNKFKVTQLYDNRMKDADLSNYNEFEI